MRVLAVLCLLLLLFGFSSLGQATSLPFAYVVELGDTDHQTFVMDAITGENKWLFEVNRGCPLSVSEDREWLVYSDYAIPANYLMNLYTGEITELEAGGITSLSWSTKYNLVAYHYWDFNQNRILVHGLVNGRQILYASLDPAYISHTDYRFVDSDLVYAIVVQDTTELQVHWLSPSRQEDKAFELSTQEAWDELTISPNGQYLLLASLEDNIYSMNLQTGEIYQIGSGMSRDHIAWLPNEEATLAYLIEDEAGNYSLETVSPEGNQKLQSNIGINISPDAHYVYFVAPEAGEESMSHVWVLNTETGESVELAEMSRWVSEVQWLSPSQLVYRHGWAEDENVNLTDIYYYDAETQENRQLTNTPELEERFDCFVG